MCRILNDYNYVLPDLVCLCLVQWTTVYKRAKNIVYKNKTTTKRYFSKFISPTSLILFVK